MVSLLITAARLHVEADLAFVDEVETELLRSGAAGQRLRCCPGRCGGGRAG